MDKPYNLEQLTKKYNEFSSSVNQCLDKLGGFDVPDSFRNLLERRVNLTFMIADFSLSSFDSYSDNILDGMREGIEDLRKRWKEYNHKSFSESQEEPDKIYFPRKYKVSS